MQQSDELTASTDMALLSSTGNSGRRASPVLTTSNSGRQAAILPPDVRTSTSATSIVSSSSNTTSTTSSIASGSPPTSPLTFAVSPPLDEPIGNIASSALPSMRHARHKRTASAGHPHFFFSLFLSIYSHSFCNRWCWRCYQSTCATNKGTTLRRLFFCWKKSQCLFLFVAWNRVRSGDININVKPFHDLILSKVNCFFRLRNTSSMPIIAPLPTSSS